MFILKEVKVVCFDTLLEVLILKGLILHQNCEKCGPLPLGFGGALILNLNKVRDFSAQASTDVNSRRVAVAHLAKLAGFVGQGA